MNNLERRQGGIGRDSAEQEVVALEAANERVAHDQEAARLTSGDVSEENFFEMTVAGTPDVYGLETNQSPAVATDVSTAVPFSAAEINHQISQNAAQRPGLTIQLLNAVQRLLGAKSQSNRI